MRQLIEAYNNFAQQAEDWAFRHLVPRVLKVVEIALRFTLIYSFYLLIVNSINELL
jgi:hypothetical protein